MKPQPGGFPRFYIERQKHLRLKISSLLNCHSGLDPESSLLIQILRNPGFLPSQE
jgi:hypothetical protein